MAEFNTEQDWNPCQSIITNRLIFKSIINENVSAWTLIQRVKTNIASLIVNNSFFIAEPVRLWVGLRLVNNAWVWLNGHVQTNTQSTTNGGHWKSPYPMSLFGYTRVIMIAARDYAMANQPPHNSLNRALCLRPAN